MFNQVLGLVIVLTSKRWFLNEAKRISLGGTCDKYLTPARLQRQQLSSITKVVFDLKVWNLYSENFLQ